MLRYLAAACLLTTALAALAPPTQAQTRPPCEYFDVCDASSYQCQTTTSDPGMFVCQGQKADGSICVAAGTDGYGGVSANACANARTWFPSCANAGATIAGTTMGTDQPACGPDPCGPPGSARACYRWEPCVTVNGAGFCETGATEWCAGTGSLTTGIRPSVCAYQDNLGEICVQVGLGGPFTPVKPVCVPA